MSVQCPNNPQNIPEPPCCAAFTDNFMKMRAKPTPCCDIRKLRKKVGAENKKEHAQTWKDVKEFQL